MVFEIANDIVTLLDELALVFESIQILHLSLRQVLESLVELLIQLFDKVNDCRKDLLVVAEKELINVSSIICGLWLVFLVNNLFLEEFNECSDCVINLEPEISGEVSFLC